MKFIYSCHTDIGTMREVNQDALVIKNIRQRGHTVLLAAICDGVGGLNQGEVTSRKTAEMLSDWFDYELPQIMASDRMDEIIVYRYRQVIADINKEIYFGNMRSRISSGTTLSTLLLWDYHYLIGHVGDSRIYSIGEYPRLLTRDHSWVEQEIRLGHMTAEEAAEDSRRNVILKCIGADQDVEPDMLEGNVEEPMVFLLCTDGFWHYVRVSEWMQYFSPEVAASENVLSSHLYYMTEQVKRRGETDNITAIAIRIV
ncbi:MAG: protein phosphatase 2C domain-containing protein [Lachnospiraceae bacterium]|nr:protein phosphatase 2C domain-containing protein [Lachnospiraceae bacterium]